MFGSMFKQLLIVFGCMCYLSFIFFPGSLASLGMDVDWQSKIMTDIKLMIE